MFNKDPNQRKLRYENNLPSSSHDCRTILRSARSGMVVQAQLCGRVVGGFICLNPFKPTATFVADFAKNLQRF
jgi:hypothetical protein